MFWAASTTTSDDTDLLAAATEVHAVGGGWLEHIRFAQVVPYR